MTVLAVFKHIVADSNTFLWPTLILLILFIFYCLKEEAHATERRIQISKLPTVTKTHWDNLVISLKLSRVHPRDMVDFFSDLFKNNGPLVHIKLMLRDYVIINDPDYIMALLSNPKHITKGPDYRMLEPWLNKGLLTSTGEKWHSRRKLLTNTFHFKILETYIPALNKHSRALVKNLTKASENDELIRDVGSHVTLCALDIVCETIMGVNIKSQEGKSSDYVNAIKTVSNILINRIITFWLWNETIFNISINGRAFYKSLKILHDFTENVIRERRQNLKSEKNPTSEKNDRKRIYSFLDLLIGISKENPSMMTDLDIREEVDTFLFEGHDTSSIAMTMALLHIGMNQNIQHNIRDELNEIFGDSDRDATLDDLNAMSYLGRVLKETMRLYPSVTGMSRELNQPLQLKNYIIPPGFIIGFSPHILHRNESIYPDPEVFNPDRFLPEQCIGRHPYSYIPFSAGPRNCIGQKFAMYQMKTVISTILRYMKLETLGTQKDIVISTQLIMRADSIPT
ncbi:cytochrome P450 4C1-like isoform X2 [Adelges cooleyi]|uniref:cytochrome P450 4C1-like isoform X2 n=1 Tax=Adelges cooleyi TaxID=133065 RepID=UPI00217FC207|nr:cytochrome P450 4C1-like isoform X2 [Adelges cooleyi]